jgi:hypothetical protein
VITVRVSDEQVAYLISLDAVLNKVKIGVCRKIDQKAVVDQRLRARADVFAAKSACFFADLAIAKYRGHTLRRGGSQKLNFHNVYPFLSIYLEYK